MSIRIVPADSRRTSSANPSNSSESSEGVGQSQHDGLARLIPARLIQAGRPAARRRRQRQPGQQGNRSIEARQLIAPLQVVLPETLRVRPAGRPHGLTRDPLPQDPGLALGQVQGAPRVPAGFRCLTSDPRCRPARVGSLATYRRAKPLGWRMRPEDVGRTFVRAWEGEQMKRLRLAAVALSRACAHWQLTEGKSRGGSAPPREYPEIMRTSSARGPSGAVSCGGYRGCP